MEVTLGAGYPAPFAPSGDSTPEVGSPAPIRRKADRLRLQTSVNAPFARSAAFVKLLRLKLGQTVAGDEESRRPGTTRENGLLTPALSPRGGEGEDSDAFAGFMPRASALGFSYSRQRLQRR